MYPTGHSAVEPQQQRKSPVAGRKYDVTRIIEGPLDHFYLPIAEAFKSYSYFVLTLLM